MASIWVVCIDGTWNQPGPTDKDPVTERKIRPGQRIHKSVIQIMQDKSAPGLEPYVPSARYNGNATISPSASPDVDPWGEL